MFKVLLVVLLSVLLLEIVRFRKYKAKVSTGFIGAVYRPTMLYSCIIDLIGGSLTYISRLVSK